MKKQAVRGFLVFAFLTAICHSGFPATNDFKREYVKAFTDAENPYDDFTSDEWSVEALFFDLNGDGKEEAILADTDQRFANGNGWVTTRLNPVTGKIEWHPRIGESGIDVYAHSRDLYAVSDVDGPVRLYGNDVGIHVLENFGTANDKQRFYKDDAIFTMDTNGMLVAKSLPNGFSDIVAGANLKRIERIETELYYGFDLELKWKSPVASDVVYAAPDGFDGFADLYRNETKSRLGVSGKVDVFAIFFDADGDGNSDFLVSSDAEQPTPGKFVWHFYRNDGGTFHKAEKTFWFNADKDYCRESIDPDETAGRNDFYLVQRHWSLAPSVIILDRDGNVFHSRTARRQWLTPPPLKPGRHLQHDEMKEHYRSLEEWRWSIKAKCGFEPAFDFEEIFSDGNFLRMERLPCASYPEKSQLSDATRRLESERNQFNTGG